MMHVLLVPGFWLDGSSWDGIVPALSNAGHTVKPLTLPGLERGAERTNIGVADHVDAVVAEIDTASGPVAVVGHSGGGPIAYAAVDARPDRVARVVYVDSGPLASGSRIDADEEFPMVDGEVPLPDWSQFGDVDLRDLTDELRGWMRSRAIPEPSQVTRDPIHLSDPRRYDVPVTVIAATFSSEQLREFMKTEHPYVRELNHARHVDFVDLPTGHWPQFTKPAELGTALVAALAP